VSLWLYGFDAAQSTVEDFALKWPCRFPSWNGKTYWFSKLIFVVAELRDGVFQIGCNGNV